MALFGKIAHSFHDPLIIEHSVKATFAAIRQHHYTGAANYEHFLARDQASQRQQILIYSDASDI